MKTNKTISQAALYIILSMLGLLLIIPFVWMLSTSLKYPGNEFNYPPQWIPDPVTLDNYKDALIRGGFIRSYYNTIKVAVLTVIPTILLTSIAGYAFVKMHFKGRDILFFLVVMLIMIPQEVTLIPNLLLMKSMGWLDKHIAIIIPNIFGSTAVFALFIMRQNYMSIPDALIESGKIDGASHLRIFFKIIFPMSKAVVAAVTIFTTMNSWNDFIYPLVYINSTEKFTLQLSLVMFKQAYGLTEWTIWMAASTVSILPILVIYLFAQKQFIDSLALSGIK